MTDLIIFGVDALEYDLVEKWNLENIKQKNYAKLKVPIGKSGYPVSSQVWPSLFAGYDVGIQGFGDIHRYQWLWNLMWRTKKFLGIYNSFGIARKICPLTKAKRFKPSEWESFLENPRIGYFNAPGYDFDNSSFQLSYEWASNQIDMDELRYKLRILIDKHLGAILDKCEKNTYPIIFVYLHALDTLQHVSFKERNVFVDYHLINGIIPKLAEYSKDLIILSDHGYNFKSGLHSLNGFISSSNDLIVNDILDFRGLIESNYKIKN